MSLWYNDVFRFQYVSPLPSGGGSSIGGGGASDSSVTGMVVNGPRSPASTSGPPLRSCETNERRGDGMYSGGGGGGGMGVSSDAIDSTGLAATLSGADFINDDLVGLPAALGDFGGTRSVVFGAKLSAVFRVGFIKDNLEANGLAAAFGDFGGASSVDFGAGFKKDDLEANELTVAFGDFGGARSVDFGAGFRKDDLEANELSAAFGDLGGAPPADCFTPKVVEGVSTGTSPVFFGVGFKSFEAEAGSRTALAGGGPFAASELAFAGGGCVDPSSMIICGGAFFKGDEGTSDIAQGDSMKKQQEDV